MTPTRPPNTLGARIYHLIEGRNPDAIPGIRGHFQRPGGHYAARGIRRLHGHRRLVYDDPSRRPTRSMRSGRARPADHRPRARSRPLAPRGPGHPHNDRSRAGEGPRSACRRASPRGQAVAAGFTMNAPFRRASRLADHRLWNLEGSAMQQSSDTSAARAAIAAVTMPHPCLGRGKEAGHDVA